MVDLNGDGIDDILTGSYQPGDLYLFRGRRDGTFMKGTVLTDAGDRPLSASEPDETGGSSRMDLVAAVPFAFDYDGDGDLDLLVGNIRGQVALILNEGSRERPVFSTTREPLKAGGEEIRVPEGDAGPVMADWDGDGVADLIVGAGDGSVLFHRNTGTQSEPVFAAAEELISGTSWASQFEEDAPAEPTRSGIRAKVCVVDYNGDGRLDLLLGDFAMQRHPVTDLTPEQVARRDELRAQKQRLSEQMSQHYQELMNELGEEGMNALDWNSDEVFSRIGAQSMPIEKELRQYEGGLYDHGWVWLYLRKGSS